MVAYERVRYRYEEWFRNRHQSIFIFLCTRLMNEMIKMQIHKLTNDGLIGRPRDGNEGFGIGDSGLSGVEDSAPLPDVDSLLVEAEITPEDESRSFSPLPIQRSMKGITYLSSGFVIYTSVVSKHGVSTT